jgi:hypothetical protein
MKSSVRSLIVSLPVAEDGVSLPVAEDGLRARAKRRRGRPGGMAKRTPSARVSAWLLGGENYSSRQAKLKHRTPCAVIIRETTKLLLALRGWWA